MTETTNDYDSPWKEALEAYFPQFMELLFPEVHAEIDWLLPYEFLDTELQKIVRDADSGRRHTDKLVKVHTKTHQQVWVLVHIEIQGRADSNFNCRMYRYHYRLSDRYPERKIASFAVLTNQQSDKKLGHYQQQFWRTENSFKFPLANRQKDWGNRMGELEASTNPFSVVILAQLMAHNLKDDRQRFDAKFRLTRLLYQRGYQKQQVLDLFRFIDWMLRLPAELELQLNHEIIRIEEKKHMAYITSIERFGIEKGRTEGEANTLLKLLGLSH